MAQDATARWQRQLEQHLSESGALLARAAHDCGEPLTAAVAAIARSLRGGGKLMICGNGGSAADSQHVAAELTSRLTADFRRPGIAALALTTDTSFLTAYANDDGFEGVFSRQIAALGRRGDALLAISTSGGSPNVLRAVAAARETGVVTVGLSGEGGALAQQVDHAIVIPSRVTAHIQEAMLCIEHVLRHALERELFPD